jgi:hypothetical protein
MLAPGIGYCHECGWWHELPRSYSFKMLIMIEMPFLRLRLEMGKLRTAMEKASKEYDQKRELYLGLEEELARFETMLSSTVELFTVKDE